MINFNLSRSSHQPKVVLDDCPPKNQAEINKQLDAWTAAAPPGENRAEAARRIRTVMMDKNEDTLDLCGLGLTSEGFPPVLGDIEWLTEIDLSHNALTAVPSYLLKHPCGDRRYGRDVDINLSYNNIRCIAALEEEGYFKLVSINLEGNQIRRIPALQAAESEIDEINLKDNKIRKVPLRVIEYQAGTPILLQGNPIRLTAQQAHVFQLIRDQLEAGVGPVIHILPDFRHRVTGIRHRTTEIVVCGVDEESSDDSSYMELNEGVIQRKRKDEKISPEVSRAALMATLSKAYEDPDRTRGMKSTRGFDAPAWEMLLTPQNGNEEELTKYAANLYKFLGRIRNDTTGRIDPARIHALLDSILAGGYSALEEIGSRVVDALTDCGERPLRTFLMLEAALKLRNVCSKNLGMPKLVDVFEEMFVVDTIRIKAAALAVAHNNVKEGIEFEMRLIEMLEKKFPLPFKASVRSLHGGVGKISQNEIAKVHDEIKLSLVGEQFIDYLSRQDLWRSACTDLLGKRIALIDEEFQQKCRDEENIHETRLSSANKSRTELASMLEEISGQTGMPESEKEGLIGRIRNDLSKADADLKTAELEKDHQLGALMQRRDAVLDKLYLAETRALVAKKRALNEGTWEDFLDF